MSQSPGFHEDFFDPDKRTDLMIEAPIDQVTPAVAEHADLPPLSGETARLVSSFLGRWSRFSSSRFWSWPTR